MANDDRLDAATIRRRLKGARQRRERAERDLQAALEDTARLIAAGRQLERRIPMAELAQLAGYSRQAGYALVAWLRDPKRPRWPTTSK